MTENIIAFIIGWFTSFAATIVYNLGIRPKIDITIGNHSTATNICQSPIGTKCRIIWLIIVNEEAHLFWRWFTERQTAWACEVTLEIFLVTNPTEKAIKDKIIARWLSTPEPTQLLFSTTNFRNAQPLPMIVFDSSKLPYTRRFDLHGGMQERIGLVIKSQGQKECHIFSNESYEYNDWQNKNWKLDQGDYLVAVQARSGRIRKQRHFKLSNQGINLDDVAVTKYD